MELSDKLFERFGQEMRVRNYSPRTIKAYAGCLRAFVRWAEPSHPRELDSDRVRAYLLQCIECGMSRSWVDQSISALKFLYVELYGMKEVDFKVKRPRREQALPYVPTKGEILQMADALENRKHRLAVLMLYGSGLRVSELVRARVQDVDLDRMLLVVRDGKGRKDRVTVISDYVHRDLAWMLGDRAANLPLLPARHGGRLATRSLQKVVRRAAAKAGVHGHVTPHSLRHAFATHLLETGTSLRYIQALLGHSRLRTTTRYTRMQDPALQGLASPL